MHNRRFVEDEEDKTPNFMGARDGDAVDLACMVPVSRFFPIS